MCVCVCVCVCVLWRRLYIYLQIHPCLEPTSLDCTRPNLNVCANIC